MINPKVLYEDKNLFVIDKPAGWITNESSTTTTQPVLQTWLRQNHKYSLDGNLELRHGIVHRLDKETSGIVLAAKTEESFYSLQAQFKERKIKKTYIALLHGRVEEGGTIKAEIGRLPWRRDRFGVLLGGRESVSDFKLLEFIPGERGGYSLVEFYPQTGRTHQIRVHAKHIGHAIVADEFYAGRKTARNDRKFCPRLFLHASKIIFENPATGKTENFTSDLPDDLKQVLEVIKS